MDLLTQCVRTIGRVLLPVHCAICRIPLVNEDDRRLCRRCWEGLERLRPWVCQRCSLPLPDGGALCWRCRTHPPALKEIRAGGLYEGTLKTCLQAFKYGGKEYLARPLAEILREGLARSPQIPPCDLITPIPLDAWRRWQRGYNQAELLCREVGRWLKGGLVVELLRKTRRTRRQVGLRRSDRLQNLTGAFAVISPVPVQGKRVLLIDDVCTTGATLQECAKALRKAGASAVYGGVVARDQTNLARDHTFSYNGNVERFEKTQS